MNLITYLATPHRAASAAGAGLPSMHRSLRRRRHDGGGGVLLLFYFLVLSSCCVGSVAPQGLFPRLENIGAHKPVSVAPETSTCGAPERSVYCQPAATAEGLGACVQQSCVQVCPYRAATPRYADLLLGAHLGACVTQDARDLRPGASSTRTSLVFRNQTDCFASPVVPALGPAGSFTLTVWLKLEASSEMTLIEKRAAGELVYSVTVSTEMLELSYRFRDALAPHRITVPTTGRINKDEWTHLALQVHGTRVSLLLDGLEGDGTAFDTHSLLGPVTDISPDSTGRLGQDSNGSNQFIGRMQDFRFYPVTLTNREIIEVFTGRLPHLHTQPDCRCPPSHPRVHPLVARYCIPNGEEDTTTNRVLRLHMDAHPLSYINDNDIGTAWLSRVFASAEQLDQGVTLTFDLQNGQYQVFYVILQFLSAQPEAVRIQRRVGMGMGDGVGGQWQDWQYLAKNCSVFGMEDNGALPHPDSVNCLQFPSEVPLSRGNITFSMLTPEPLPRPGYNDFYNSPPLQAFVLASAVRIQLLGQYHTTQGPGVNPQHRYYGVDEITISGRCDCHGHADSCDTQRNPYRCACSPESHTLGDNCERCAPLFNDKPFRSGDQLQAYNCRPCQCGGHASSCHYDPTLDPYPTEHFRGGGGVCDDCQHNTTGRQCERCQPLFYRVAWSVSSAVDACRPCDCHANGTVNGTLECEEMGGQCKCKRHVSGRRCDECPRGFYGLRGAGGRAEGCVACDCNAAGTSAADITCHQDSGQCHCKTHVIGLTCDRCDYGFKFLNLSDPEGCSPCGCHADGSLHQFCNPFSGRCECKEHVRGLLCDSCAPGHYGLDSSLLGGGGECRPCGCDPAGTLPAPGGTGTCDLKTGQCPCKAHVWGRRCDTCRPGYHSLERLRVDSDSDSSTLGCLPCQCDTRGTVNGSDVCHPGTGQCPCKERTEGLRCDVCAQNTFNRSDSDGSYDCAPCRCDREGTVLGSVCDPLSGQCVCLPSRQGQDCGICRPGFFLSAGGVSGCDMCECHPAGALGPECDAHSGACVCGHPSVRGRRCDQCQPLHYAFNSSTGRCQECGCDPGGSLNGSCAPDSGVCVCKPFVAGSKCDACVAGAGHLDPNNHLGCSKAPSQQPAPEGHVQSSSAVQLTWGPPDSPNSNVLSYQLLRDNRTIHTIHSYHPFNSMLFDDEGLRPHQLYSYRLVTNSMLFDDEGLSPHQLYSYRLVTSTVQGSTSSPEVGYRTLASVPAPEHLLLLQQGRAKPHSASFNWTSSLSLLQDPNPDSSDSAHGGGASSGHVERYVLSSVEQGGRSSAGKEVVHYTGLQTEATVTGLRPFTRYAFTLSACTSGGCGRSEPVVVVTSQVPPLNQAPPRVTPTGSGEVEVEWDPPEQANGVIIRYELFMRGPLQSPDGNNSTHTNHTNHINDTHPAPQAQEERAFLSSGWLNPQPLIRSTNENSLSPPPQSSTKLSGLEPFSWYAFRLLTVNMAGSTMSEWVTQRTAEDVPVNMPTPEVTPLTSTSLKVSWRSPSDRDARGEVTEFRVSIQEVRRSKPYTLVLHTASSGERSYTAEGLLPYRLYNVTVTLCNAHGCVDSQPASGRTLPAAPTGMSRPKLTALNSTVMGLSWPEPQEMNGPPPLYQVERTDVSLSDPYDPVTRGIRFPGHAYYRFPSTTLPVNTDFTGLQLSFRTRALNGLILCALSPGDQEEYVALQIQNGRPYFLFDPQASAVALSPQGDGGRSYSDGQWHHVIATRKQAVGTIIVDNQYRGTASASSGSTIIGENSGVFVGGLPKGFSVLRQDTGAARLVTEGFVGCLRDVLLLRSQRPLLQWEPLRWDSALETTHTYHSWEGCPTHRDPGAHFLGQGYLELKRELFSGGQDFHISFDFKTDQLNALLLFAYHEDGDDYIMAELEGGILTWSLQWAGHLTQVSLWVGLSYCDGSWNSISVSKRGAVATASLDQASEQERAPHRGVLKVTSPLYLGGLPPHLHLHQRTPAGFGHLHGFGGCVKDVRLGRGAVLNLAAMSSDAERVDLSGCLSADSSVHCRGNDSILIYTGRDQHTHDFNLQPFTEYMYRVMASGEGGWVAGPWERGRSRGTAAVSVWAPSRASAVDGYGAEVSWEAAAGVRGVIESYVLKAYNLDQPATAPLTATFLHQLTGNLTGLSPYTRYRLTVTACTAAGCVESRDGQSLSTPQEAPEEVLAPKAVAEPSSLLVQWSAPERPNGIITEYRLYKDHTLIYHGNGTHLNITGLGVYSSHLLVLSVCTVAGCTNSSEVTLYTGQLPPASVNAPTLTPLDSHTIYIQWSAPLEVNGVLEFYLVYLWSAGGGRPAVVFNSTELQEEHTLRNLTPGTTYYIQIAACSGGGCTPSVPVEVRTEESSPEEVPPPRVEPLSPTSLNVSWGPPRHPNGVISEYRLWMDGAVISSSSSLTAVVTHLTPWSLHSLRLQACTAKGCALGPVVWVRTLESAPEGDVELEMLSNGPSAVKARWTAPANPNGNLTYTLLFTGTFYDAPVWNSSGVVPEEAEVEVEVEVRALLNSSVAGQWVSVEGLRAYSNYTVALQACNTQGCLTSAQQPLTMPPGAPDGLLPPRLLSSSGRSLQLSWSPPARSNGPGTLRYQLHMRTSAQCQLHIQLVDSVQPGFEYTVEGLRPYTEYQFRLLASHDHGETATPWVTLTTAQDRPGAVDPPSVSAVLPSSATLSWVPPSQPNGPLRHYKLYHGTQLLATLPGNTTTFTVTPLRPYSNYTLQVEACTDAGCTLSPPSLAFRTPPAPPEDVSPPQLYSDTPTSVVLSWAPPGRPNGELDGYTLERRVGSTQQVSTVAQLSPQDPLSFLDGSGSPALSPWTRYEYRLVAHTRDAGSTGSEWAGVTTRPSRPAGLMPPHVTVLGPDSLQVWWSPPLIANGEIERYELRLPDPRISYANTSSSSVLNHTITQLRPYTAYSVTLLACSAGNGHVGGCTESLPTPVTTLPTIPQGLGALNILPVSENFLNISWEPPSRPNGPNIRFELLRRKVQAPLAPRPPEDLHLWTNVYAGTALLHQDKGLHRFTEYQYKLLVHNEVGYSSGEIASAYTLAGVPRKASSITSLSVTHTSIQVNWTAPSLQDLQGAVVGYTLWLNSSTEGLQSHRFGPNTTSALVSDLQPSTHYSLTVEVSNGAHSTTSTPINIATESGEPEGVIPPEVVTLNSTSVSVQWEEPLVANGPITNYSVYVDGQVHDTTNGDTYSLELTHLLPFTVYNIQVEVCNVYACARSNSTQVTTVEDLPGDIMPPHVQVLGSRSVRVSWSSPGQPNGILQGYEVRRVSVWPCGDPRHQPARRPHTHCPLLRCPKPQHICGSACYLPTQQVCCDGVVHSRAVGHECCGDAYLPVRNASESVCCGRQLLAPLPQHQCCGGYYVPVPPGEVCCPDPDQKRVSVGLGDTCCGGRPFSRWGGQLCCGGVLHDGFQSQCCGGRVISHSLHCCGDEETGVAHTPAPGMLCCGELYVNSSEVLCCGGVGDLEATPHHLDNHTMTRKCCGAGVIPQEEECCNGIGYDPKHYFCADRASPGIHMQEACKPSALCPLSSVSSAYCGVCDFNPAVEVCSRVAGLPPQSLPSSSSSDSAQGVGAEPDLCASPEEVVYSGSTNRYTFTDTNLEPHSSYEYRVGSWNSFGRGYSSSARVITREDAPAGLPTPHWTKLQNRDDIIQLDWAPPHRPNGEIQYYVVLRDGQERYRGNESSFTDVGGIMPYQEYQYQLRACTAAGCTDSKKVVAVTVQGVPDAVSSPVVSALSPSSLLLSWAPPARPNGILRHYHINQTGAAAGRIHTHTGERELQYTVTGLQPHTDYSFVLEACTSAGCRASQPATGRTLQDAPAGVWSNPRHVLVSCSVVELFWDQPERPHGILSSYTLLRDSVALYTGEPDTHNYTDTGLQPNTRYIYELEASTGGGVSRSGRYVVQTPISSPEDIPPPHNVTVIGPHAIFVAWAPPGKYNTSVPLDYSVLLNAGSLDGLVQPAGRDQYLQLTSLMSYTRYHIRIQACQPEGCGVGQGVYTRTLEAPPEHLDAPVVKATGPKVIEVSWKPPRRPNGLITAYFIHRRPLGSQEELLVFLWSSGPLEFIDASDNLLPHSGYEYRARAHNAQGSVSSPWSPPTRTLEAQPRGMALPWARPVSAYSLLLNWTGPSQPNGVIQRYRVLYQKRPSDPTLNSSAVLALTVPGDTEQAHVFGLEPFSTYSVRVEATNAAGSASSPWAAVRTLEAPPGGVANFSVEKREQGRALMLTWDPPHTPNGEIKMYNIYNEGNLEFSGLSRQFLFRRLEPFTTYTLLLEACTEAGCTRTGPQPITTDEAPPSAPPPLVAQHIGAESVQLSWEPPAHPNGRLLQYQLLAVAVETGRSRTDEDDLQRAKVIFLETETRGSSYSHNVTGLHPWSQYGFLLRVLNAAGHADTPWLTLRTKQASPRGLAAPVVSHVEGQPQQLQISWRPPLESNGVLLSYRLRRDNLSFPFSFDASVLSYRDDEGLLPFALYSYAVTACTSEGCVTSDPTAARTLEAPPELVHPPTLANVTAHSATVAWDATPIQNGEVTLYALQVDGEEVYRGRGLLASATGLLPHTQYSLQLTACTNGGCTHSAPTLIRTLEAPPSDLQAPLLKVTGAESVEVSWAEPGRTNGVITGYELRRNGQLVYAGMDTRYHDFTLMPSVEYSYAVTANNSRGATTSPASVARTHPSAPSGVAPPRLQASGASSVLVSWEAPARPNGVITSYTLYSRDPADLGDPNPRRYLLAPEHAAYQSRTTTLTGLKPYYRYEVRVEACTLLGCAASDWASVMTLEAPPSGQTAPLLELQVNTLGLQTVFLLSWSPPAQPNGRLLHYELLRRRLLEGEAVTAATMVYHNTSTIYRDDNLAPYTAYEYQVWSVNSAGRAGSPWTRGRTGPAPPEGLAPPTFLRVHATSAIVDISPPSKPNGIVSLYRVYAHTNDTDLLLSEGTSRQQTLHGLRPYTLYSVGVEACTCFLCCSRGPISKLRTQPSAPAQQPPPRPVSLTSRSALVEWDQPLQPNGVIESCELHVRSSCPQPLQPMPVECRRGPVETRFYGRGQSYNVTSLRPYAAYDLRVVSTNSMGSTTSPWLTITTLKEAPQYLEAFVIQSNLTVVYVDWSDSFSLNGPLREYKLTESENLLYTGLQNALYIPRTSDKTFSFQVTCTTDSGSVISPIIRYNSATGVCPIAPTEGGKTGLHGGVSGLYSELWFLVLMGLLGLLLLAVCIGLLLRRALKKNAFTRERPPLVPLQKRSQHYPASDAYMFDSVLETIDSSTSVTLKGFIMHTEGFVDTKIDGTPLRSGRHGYPATMSVLRIPAQSHISHAYSQNSLHRSISQLIDTADRKSLMEDGIWDPELHGTDSGMFAGDEELAETIKGLSSMGSGSIRKEHTTFTDTHL
ncbi:usherin [Engraulis encrasicolus]|uniref:usherin n=1 Tax=Engraulis encrasicolus TaxID=184585 RepID=UPI002FD711B8